MKKLLHIVFAGFMAFVLLICCNRHESNYKKKLRVPVEPVTDLTFDRYEDVLFNLDTVDFQQEVMAIQKDYSPFLSGDLSNPEAVNYLQDFATDTFSIYLYNKVKEAFPELDQVKKIVNTVYAHCRYYYPDINLPCHVFTCVSGIQPETPPVMILDDGLVISLDWYLDGDEVYDWIGMPKYRSERTCLASLAKDLGQEIYLDYLPTGHKQSNLLEEMIYAGKMYYFIEAMSPDISDEVLLGYTHDQMQWAEINEGELWADLVGNQRLYETGLEMYRVFLLDGPFTNEYSHEAPPRLGEFLGLHIVRSYMNTHELSLQELMQIDDLQGLFLESGYKPKK